MAGIIAIRPHLLGRALRTIRNRRLVSTSNKNHDTVTAEATTTTDTKAVVEKNWVSYGFHKKSKVEDRNAMHSIAFISITVCLVVGGFYLAYVPDMGLLDWSQREAYLELKRREENGLPLVDPNFIDPAKIALPSDEELGDTDIII